MFRFIAIIIVMIVTDLTSNIFIFIVLYIEYVISSSIFSYLISMKFNNPHHAQLFVYINIFLKNIGFYV